VNKDIKKTVQKKKNQHDTHYIFAPFSSLFLILFILLLSVLFLFYTPAGTHTIVNIVNSAQSGLTLKGPQGSLLGGLSLQKIIWNRERAHVELHDVNLLLSRSIYSDNMLNIKRLSADVLKIYVPEGKSRQAEDDNKKITIPDIPIPLNLRVSGRIDLSSIQIIKKNELIFEVRDIALINPVLKDGLINAESLEAGPIIRGKPLSVRATEVSLDLNQPHAMSGKGALHYSHLQVGTFNGPFTFGGTLTDYELESDNIIWKTRIFGKTKLAIKGKGDYDHAEVISLRADSSQGRITGKGVITWLPELTWKANITGEQVLTQKFLPTMPANIDFEVDTSGNIKEGNPEVLATIRSMEGEINGFPLSAKGGITFKDSTLRAENLALRTGNNRINITGKATEPFDIKWDLDARNLAQVIPGFKGQVVGKGILIGTTILPLGKGNLRIRNLHSDIINIASADVDFEGGEKDTLITGKGKIRLKNVRGDGYSLAGANLDFSGNERNLVINGNVSKLKAVDQIIKQAKIKASGNVENHKIEFRANHNEGELNLLAQGGWSHSQWQGTLNKLTVNKTAAGNWRVTKPVRMTLSGQQFKGSEVCINNPKRGNLCATTSWSANSGLKTEGRLTGIPLSQLKPWLPDMIRLPGQVNGNFSIQQIATSPGPKFKGNVDLQLPDNLIIIKDGEGNHEKLHYRKATIKAVMKGDVVDVTSRIHIDKRGTMKGKAKITLAANNKHRINGDVGIDITNLAWAQEFLPDIDRLKGKVSGRVQISGLLSQPDISGEVDLKKGHFKLPDTGTTLSNINLSIRTKNKGAAVINGTLKAGQGILSAKGTLSYKDLEKWNAEVRLSGDNLSFMNTHEIKASISPDIVILANNSGIDIKGKLLIPQADIRLNDIPETAAYESEDVVILGEKNKQDKKKGMVVRPDVRILLGDKITFNGFGLVAKFKGNFYITHTRGNVFSQGTLKVVDGIYEAYGQKLKIEHGILVFNGPPSNPGMNIRATREIEDIKVGLHLGGTLQSPKSKIFSEPPLSESDALSYLITGHSITSASGGEAQLLLSAVRSLGVSSGNALLGKIGASVGLDDVNIITHNDYRKNQLQLGKQLGTKLYVRYITGIFESFHKISIDYKINKRLRVEANTGEDQGLDFIYEFERD
jgi:translocation and assembly module TamB